MTALTNDFKVRNSSRRSTLAVEEAVDDKIPSSDIGLNHDLHTSRTTSEHSSIFPKTYGTTLREKIFICSLCSGGDHLTIGVVAGSVAFALLLLIVVLVSNDWTNVHLLGSSCR